MVQLGFLRFAMRCRVHRARLPARGKNRIDDKIQKIYDEQGTRFSLSNHVIRLKQEGCINRQYYTVVLAERFSHPHDSIEQLGSFDPIPNRFNEKLCGLNYSRIKYHMAMGAHPTLPIRRLLGLAGFLPLDPTTKIFAKGLKRRRKIEEIIRKKEEIENPLEQKNSEDKATAAS